MGILSLKSKWKRWTFPSKITVIALPVTIIGILITILLSKSSNQVKISNMTGDFVGRDKNIYQSQIILPEAEKKDDLETKIKTSKIKIDRFFQDFDSQIESIKQEYQKENSRIVSVFSSRGMAQSGEHIEAQMEYARNAKNKIETILTNLNRNIEDILLENFNITTLEENDEFKKEASLLIQEKEKVKNIYKLFEDTVKGWEKRCLGHIELTKDFRL
ncbi:MAG: hypothetical protein MUO91_03765 [candidate division Zixibacteria bacterium]|nr:hypothetical protein [candidate division Zixibacteria bacterium]